MEKQALLEGDVPVPDAGGASYFPYVQETFPYFVNRLGDIQIVEGQAEDLYHYSLNIEALLVTGHITSGYKGEKQDLIYDHITSIIDYFSRNRSLTSTDYPNPPQYLYPLDMTLDMSPGVNVFTNSGMGVQQVGSRFTLSVEYEFLL
jgi:hypothetical protein